MSESLTVRGSAEGSFAPIADVLGRSAAGVGLIHGGAALSVRHHGKPVVDLVLGDYDSSRRQVLFSVTKIVTAMSVFAARDAGIVDLDQPMSERWSSMDHPGAREVTLRHVLSHRSGINGVDGTFSASSFAQGDDVLAAAAQTPRWRPGTRHGYHTVTFGSLIRGYLEHVGDAAFSDLFNSLVSPVAGDRLSIAGTATGFDDVQSILFSPPRDIRTPADQSPAFARDALIESLLADVSVFNSIPFLSATIPGLNAVGTAPALADLLASAGRGQIISDKSLEEMVSLESHGTDATLGVPSAFGAGVQRPFPRFPMTSANAWGHEGAGGCAAFYDPDRDLAVGFTTNAFPPYTGHSPMLSAVLPSIILAADSDI
ncbi:serine hydrolase domain-containing protein [Microbacterium sp. LMC-P-041]|uniref:serine hydrolase domain-containing protein n=1 Tax=Microbacterium sp. LMC-P-041 TaxID=3040293 RepID=UPI0025542264|nr:serine hydrolase domain-containing protein [Microbacterium sp. LMC-P-041]